MSHIDEPARAAYAERLALATAERPPGDDPLSPFLPARTGTTTAALNRLADLASRLVHSRSAQVSVIAAEQHVVGGSGMALPSVGVISPADESLCTVTTNVGEPLLITDAAHDPRVSDLPPVASGAVGSYLGVPMVAGNGLVLGAFCVFDPLPRLWGPRDVEVIEELARLATAELEAAGAHADLPDDRAIWRLAVDAAGVGAFDWHLPTDELRWDDRLLELFGHTRETFGGTIGAFNASVHPEDVDRVGQALQQAIDTCGTYEAEYRVIWPNGETRWIAARGHALAGADGLAVKVVGAAYDTTAVREGDARVSRVLESMPTAFFQLDPQWRFAFVNAECERLLGRTRSELVGGNVWELFPAAVGSPFEEHYRGAVESGEPVAFEAYYPPPLDAWYEVRAWPSPDGLAVYFVDITARHYAQEQVDLSRRRSEVLASLSGALSSTLDTEEAVRALAPLLVPDLADWCLVSVTGDGHTVSDWRDDLRDVGYWHHDPERRVLVEKYAAARLPALTDESYLARALTSDLPLPIPAPAVDSVRAVIEPGPARDLIGRLDPGSGVVVPLRGRNRVVGLLTLFRDRGRSEFGADDLALLDDIGVRAGLAMDNARLFGEQRELAETLQRSLLSDPPRPEGVDLAVRYEPAADAAQVGGDWYDSFQQDDGSTLLVIGDVVGHDINAAASMGQLRSLMRGIAFHTGEGPAALLRGVDRAMLGLAADTTATAIVGRLERIEGGQRLHWSNAGHPPPFVLRADGSVESLEREETDLLLGFEPDAARREHAVDLMAGDTLLLYTDGLVERRAAGIDEGIARLEKLLIALGPAPTPDEIAERMLAELMPDRADDDVAVLVVRPVR